MHKNIMISKEDLDLIDADPRTRASHSLKLRQSNGKTTELLQSFAPKTIVEWNHLPASMAEAGNLDMFKIQLAAPRAV